MLSVICPTYNEEKYITSCIDSILCQNYPHEDMEVLFVDGMSKDRTREIIQEYSTRYPFIRLINNPQRIVPYAMNAGIEKAKGDIVIRIDAHAFYAPNYFLILVDYLQRLDADNVGAICRTDVLNKTPKTLAIREILSNRFGVGNSLFRVGVDRVAEVDTVPFGCYRKSVFERWGKYDTRLVRNQDIELNKRIKRGGGKIVIVPDTYCTYLARESFQAIMRNNYSNGKWNILTVYYTKQFNSLSMRHFIPLFFLLSLLVPPLLALLYRPFIYLSVLSAGVYLIALIALGGACTLKKKLNLFYVMLGFAVLHLSYGWGSFIGICQVVFKRKE